MDANILKHERGLPYKYAVYSHLSRHPVEFLYHAPKPAGGKAVATRCLKIPKEKLSVGG